MERVFPEQIFIYEESGNGAVIRRCYSRDSEAVIPQQIGELKVKALGPYCFSAHINEAELELQWKLGKLKTSCTGLQEIDLSMIQSVQDLEKQMPVLCGDRLTGVILPESVTRMGRYCFYNCDHLTDLEFFSTLTDFGGGLFTGCHHIRHLKFHLKEDEKSVLKEVLDGLPELMTVEYWIASEDETEKKPDAPTAVLLFPDYFEEGIENTPARILEERIHGSGMMYRNCFKNRVLDFAQYDEQLPRAIDLEGFEVVSELVMTRLNHPFRLSEKARNMYQDYIRSEKEAFAAWFIREKNLEGIRLLQMLTGENDPAWNARLLELAGKSGFAEAVSFLMESRRSVSKETKEQTGEKRKRRKFEL